MTQIIVGKLANPDLILTKDGSVEIRDWQYRSMWSMLRLQHGRSIDQAIKVHMDEAARKLGLEDRKQLKFDERCREMDSFFKKAIEVQGKPKEIQFIMTDDGSLVAVASLKHLLVPPEIVYEVADNLVSSQYPNAYALTGSGYLHGLTYVLSEEQGEKKGFQLSAGDITTRLAIRISSLVRIEACLNVLSWMGVGNFRRFGILGGFERVLRIKAKEELEPRIKVGIENILKGKDKLEQFKARSQKVPMSSKTAKVLSSAMALSYGLGANTITEILNQFEKEKQTQYGLSMAASWVAAHGSESKYEYVKNSHVQQRISTIAGATLLIDDISKSEVKSLDWLKAHVKAGTMKPVEDLLKDVLK